ncbi:hypothetical protein [Gordonia otitidis]|uniref:Uncharacterized protein n=1 Tax=Gordonia otitidis (strain DSM 44809 / CCUG 52243 / JCM 12355 / NBRC 100426 / IFM 10032) TaxID=1108044 RepID=H5TGX0_GORO1|nr:hypothetical protein [Gordonia otitidis]GAB32728.1 hypothetical protein GOOTI_025_00080 [Gordonia otitidis NBRC 100426]
MSEALATVDRLSARLGVALAANTADYARAEEALWSSSVQARSLAGRPDWTVENIPNGAVDVVLSAALRIYRNPDWYIANQAGTYQATLASSDFSTGNIFLSGEIQELKKYAALNLHVVSVYRDDQRVNPRFDPANYTSIPVDGCLGDPVYGWNGEFDR